MAKVIDFSKPLNLASQSFIEGTPELLDEIREQHPVQRARISVMKVYLVSRYDDCARVLKDPLIMRNRTSATGGRRLPFPTPRSMAPLMNNLILEDDPNHRRLRNLVREPFKPQAIGALSTRIEAYCHQLLDELGTSPSFDLMPAYALPLPTRVIQQLMGVPESAMARFQGLFNLAGSGFSGLRVLRTLFFDMPAMIRFVRDLVRSKRDDPGDDLLTRLLEAEADGERLTEDEIVSLVFLLVIAGFETTVHLISNGVLSLLQHPDAAARLRAEPEGYGSAVEEILRYRGPILTTKPNYLSAPLELHGTEIPEGAAVLPLLAAGNRDPRVFDQPTRFLPERTPNHHLGFGHGVHYCLGAHLARLETRIALRVLFERHPGLALAAPASTLRRQFIPGWHRYETMPLRIQ